MFIKYLLQNFSNVFGTWIFLTMLNQLVFFGSCLSPACILASMPHVSVITLIVLYNIYNHEKTTYDPGTGYNGLGFNKAGYNSDGYNEAGYDRNGFNLDGYDMYGKDRRGKGLLGRLFTGADYAKDISKLNKEAISNNQRKSTVKAAYDITDISGMHVSLEGQETLTSVHDFNSDIAKEGGAVKDSESIGATDALKNLDEYKAELRAKLDAARAARV